MDGFAIFHYDPSGQEAVVPLQTPGVQQSLAFDNTNGVSTGVAFDNPNTLNAAIQASFFDDMGNSLGTGSIELPSGGHTSFVLATQFPVTANVRGMMAFSANCQNPFIGEYLCATPALGIRYTPPGTLTTIPELSGPAGTTYPGPSEGLMPHIASGDGWETTFVLSNSNNVAGSAQLSFYDDNGNPLPLPLATLETGATTTASSITPNIPALGSLWIQTSGALGTALLTGSAQVSGIGGTTSGYAIFRYNPNGQEAVVPLETRNAGSYLIAFDNTNNTATGVAVSVASTQAVSVPYIIRDVNGNQLATGTIPLAANGHTSFMLASQMPATAGIAGTVEFDTPAGAQISVLGIRSPPALTFTTLPPLAK
jgi:hypothetical protein